MTLAVKKSKPLLDSVIYRNFADIEEQRVDWLWPGRIATKANVLGGAPGVGKSQLIANYIATVTTAGRWPDNTPCKLGSAIIATSEDDAADTIKPRLRAAGANLSKVVILDAIDTVDGRKPWTLDDADELEALIEEQGDTRLIALDPVTQFLGKRDGHNTADVRGVLAPIQSLADKHHVCILMICHLNKSQGVGAGDRFNGSTAWPAVSRSAWLVGQHPHDEKQRVIVPVKNNLGDDKTGFAYTIEGCNTETGIPTSRIVWAGETELAANDVINGPAKSPDDPEDQSAKANAARFLAEQLKDGPKASREIWEASREAGIAEKTLKRAKKDMGIESVKDGTRHVMQFVSESEESARGSDDPTPDDDPLDPDDPHHTNIVQQGGQEGQGGQRLGVGVSDPHDINLKNF